MKDRTYDLICGGEASAYSSGGLPGSTEDVGGLQNNYRGPMPMGYAFIKSPAPPYPQLTAWDHSEVSSPSPPVDEAGNYLRCIHHHKSCGNKPLRRLHHHDERTIGRHSLDHYYNTSFEPHTAGSSAEPSFPPVIREALAVRMHQHPPHHHHHHHGASSLDNVVRALQSCSADPLTVYAHRHRGGAARGGSSSLSRHSCSEYSECPPAFHALHHSSSLARTEGGAGAQPSAFGTARHRRHSAVAYHDSSVSSLSGGGGRGPVCPTAWSKLLVEISPLPPRE